MQYPHWIILAGAALVALGFIGLALRQKRDVELDHEQTEVKANGKRDGRDSNAPPFPLGHGARHLKRAKPSGPPHFTWLAQETASQPVGGLAKRNPPSFYTRPCNGGLHSPKPPSKLPPPSSTSPQTAPSAAPSPPP